MELKVDSDRVKKAAEKCSQADRVLRELFPEAFENDKKFRVELWDETRKAGSFRLAKFDRGLSLQVVDENGNCDTGHLLYISPAGTFRLESGVGKQFGFKLDGIGKIVTE